MWTGDRRVAISRYLATDDLQVPLWGKLMCMYVYKCFLEGGISQLETEEGQDCTSEYQSIPKPGRTWSLYTKETGPEQTRQIQYATDIVVCQKPQVIASHPSSRSAGPRPARTRRDKSVRRTD